MDPALVEFLKYAAPVLAGGGFAWGGAKAALNGTRARVQTVEEDLKNHKEDSIDRLARIETKIDVLTEKK